MEDLKELDALMRRAKSVENSDKRRAQHEAQAIRASYAPQIADLRRAEALLLEHHQEAKQIESYAEKFPWHMARATGMPADVQGLLGELRRCTSLGLNSIRQTIEKIEGFKADDVPGRWRPARDVSSIVATAGHMLQTMEAIKRQLEYWGRRLEEKLPPIAGGYEAIEGVTPIEGGADLVSVISNMRN